jgi:UDP-GlcNAc:undecaprenyl-phosphate GlcNAc-1-phosphate transferase
MHSTQPLRALMEVAPSAVVAGCIALLLAVALIVLRRPHARATGERRIPTARESHPDALPRIGGVAIVGGFLVGLLHLLVTRDVVPAGIAWAVVAALVPIAGCGVAEDLTRRVGPRQRLAWMTLGALGLSASGVLVLQRTDVPPLDAVLAFAPLAVLFTAFACVGAANAFNVTDGLDGMLGGIALITLSAIAWVAHEVDDRLVLSMAVLLGGAVLGWLPFNWPRAAMFAGDGGAYAIGFLCAVMLLMLVIRHPEVSPWFGLTAAALPVWETLYSIGRRVRTGRSSLEADRAHLHQLVQDRLLRARAERASSRAAADDAPASDPRRVAAPNGLVSPVMWLLHGGVVFASLFTYRDTDAQMLLFLGFALVYAIAYRLLSRTQPTSARLDVAARAGPDVRQAESVALARPVGRASATQPRPPTGLRH